MKLSIRLLVLLLVCAAPYCWAQAPAFCEQAMAKQAGDREAHSASPILAGWQATLPPEQRSLLKDFYAPCGYALAWNEDGKLTLQAVQMLSVFANAGEQGLRPADYISDRAREQLGLNGPLSQKREGKALARVDLAITAGAMRLVSDLQCGRTRTELSPSVDRQECKNPQPPAFIWSRLVRAENLSAAMAELAPTAPGYQRTKAALQLYRTLAQRGGEDRVPSVAKTISPGARYDGVAQLAARLRLMGDLKETISAGEVYEGPLVDAVKSFQRRHGISPGGVLDGPTIRAINAPFAQRVQQLALTLERWRTVPRVFAHPPIVVNIPEFQLRAYDSRLQVALSMKVIVGKAYRYRTPLFAGEMSSVVFRPYWDVPRSILRSEIVPAIRRDPKYLEKHNFEMVTRSGQVISGNGTAQLGALEAGQIRVRQKPGGDNALGPVKFLFPNTHNVYLHGTPAQALFAKSRRDFSHGCIRLEDPNALAVWVLRGEPGWSRERIEQVERGTQPTTVAVKPPIPVLIVYGTGFAAEDGRVYFLPDLYGDNGVLLKALDALSKKRAQDEAQWMAVTM